MNIRCPLCNKFVEVPSEPDVGQHVLCPWCHGKFSYKPAILKPQRSAVPIVLLSVALVAVAGALGWMILSRQAQKTRLESIKAEVEKVGDDLARERLRLRETERRMDDRERLRADAETERSMALQGLTDYLRREEANLERIVRESESTVTEIAADRRSLTDVMLELDRENARLAERARTNGWTRYDKAERVMMMLKHPRMNELAIKYLGEDFSVLTSECRGKIKELLEFESESSRRLAANRKRYDQQIAGIDVQVDERTAEARKLSVDTKDDLEKRLGELLAQRDAKVAALIRLKQQRSKTKAVQSEISALQEEVVSLEKEVGGLREVISVNRANAANLAATVAETGARRKGDRALGERQDADNAVHADMSNKRAVFNLAATYEGRSLDVLCEAMRTRTDTMVVRAEDARRKLQVIRQASSNVDMMDVGQIESLKRRIADTVSEKIIEVGQ